MAGPITWRNVEGPSIRDAALMFRGASDQINTGLAGFGNIIKESEDIQAANVRATEEVGKQNYLDLLQSARTPEELAALQASGQAEALRASLGAAGRNATRGAAEARTTSLRAGVTAETAFRNQQLDEAEKPIKAELDALALTDPVGARAKALQYQAEGKLRTAAPILKDAQAAERDNFRWNRTQLEATNADQDRKRLVEVVQPRQDAAAVSEAATRALNLKRAGMEMTETERKLAEDAESRTADRVLQEAANGYQSQQAENRQKVNAEAKAFGAPVKADGSVNANAMKTEDVIKFDAHLTSKGLPTLTSTIAGDTQVRDRFLANFKKDNPTASAATIARVEAQSILGFDSTKPGKIGTDAEKLARDQKISDNELAEAEARYGSIATPGNIEGLMDSSVKIIKELAPDSPGKQQDWRIAVQKFLDQGGIVPKDENGKPLLDSKGQPAMRVLPNEAQLKRLLYGIDQRYFTRGRVEIEEKLEEWAKSPEALNGASELYRLDANRRIRGVDRETPAKAPDKPAKK